MTTDKTLPEPVGWRWRSTLSEAEGVYWEHPSKYGIDMDVDMYKWTALYTAEQLRAALAAQAEEIAELKEAYALLFKANAELRVLLDRPQVLHECLTNDSPWLICKHCGAVGRCAMEKS